MTDFYYTKEYDVDSSLVSGVFYNENDTTLTLSFNGELYRYSGVYNHDVADLVDAPSVGAYFNTYFKHEFGPGEYLGHEHWTASRLVPVEKQTPGTPKGLVAGETFAYDLNRFDIKDTSSAAAVEPTKEYSLTLPAEEGFVPTHTTTVYFTLDGFDKEYEYTAKADDVNDAVEELNDYVASFGATGKVRRVVVDFE